MKALVFILGMLVATAFAASAQASAVYYGHGGYYYPGSQVTVTYHTYPSYYYSYGHYDYYYPYYGYYDYYYPYVYGGYYCDCWGASYCYC